MDSTSTGTTKRAAGREIILSLLRVATLVLKSRRRIGVCVIIGGALASVLTLRQPRVFTALASFLPQGSADANAGLRSLAGQFGIPVGTASAAQSPDFYAWLVTSPLVLAPIAADSFSVSEDNGPKTAFEDLMEVRATLPAQRLESATTQLRDAASAAVDKKTGVITVRITTRWRSVSLAIAARLLQGANDFNLKTRQSQASEERRFTEHRTALALDSLRTKEDELQRFLEGNRQLQAPRLKFEQDRLEREVALRQQVVVTLAQALEDARLREVRDTPVITVIQGATAKTKPDSRGVVMLGFLGMIAGGAFGVLVVFLLEEAGTARVEGEPETSSFAAALDATRQDVRRLWRHREP